MEIMNEVNSLVEILEKFESEWILIENPETEEGLKIKSGKILWHSKDRDEVYRKAKEIKPEHSVIFYTCQIPQDTVIIL